MTARGFVAAVVLAHVFLLTLTGLPAPIADANDGVEHRIATFWERINALRPTDHVLAADIGQWALNVIERDSRTRLTLSDFKTATAAMQAAFERAGLAPGPAAPPGNNVEERIASFWSRIGTLPPNGFVSSNDLGQWALNVIDRDSRTRVTVADFRSTTAVMQAAFERAGPALAAQPTTPPARTPAPTAAAVRTPVPTAAPARTISPVATLPVLALYPNVGIRLLLRASIDAGRYAELSDGSIWEVGLFDRFTSRFWTRFDEVIVSEDRYAVFANSYLVTNLDTRETVSARYHRVARRWIADRLTDRDVVVLDDDSIWEISSFDSFEAVLWGWLDDVVIVADTGPYYGYRMVNLTDRSAASVRRIR